MTKKRTRTVHDLPQPLRAVAWVAAYVLLFCVSISVGLLTGLTAFQDDWKDSREQMKRAAGAARR